MAKLTNKERLKELCKRKGPIADLEKKINSFGYKVYHYEQTNLRRGIVVELTRFDTLPIKATGHTLLQAMTRAFAKLPDHNTLVN